MAVPALTPPEGENTEMNKRDLAAGLDTASNAVASTVSPGKPGTIWAGFGYVKQHAANAVASTVYLAKPATVAAGLGHVKHHATNAVASTVSLAKPATVAAGLGAVGRHAAGAVASTASLAKPSSVAAGLGHVKQYATGMVSTREGAAKTAAVVIGGAVGAYFLWPAAAAPAVLGATMKAPGAAGFIISRAAFGANPQLYFQILRTAGGAAAAAAFAVAV